MASTDIYDGFAPTPAAQPEQPQDTSGDIYSGFSPVSPTAAAKATAVGTTTPPEEAGSTYSQAVKTSTPPEVIKADPAAFTKTQRDKEQSAAIDGNQTLAHFINSVPDGAAITEGDQLALAGINTTADGLKSDVVSQFLYDWFAKPLMDTAEYGADQLKQSFKEGSADDIGTRLLAVAPLAKGLFALGGAAAYPEAIPAINAYTKVVSKLTGIPEDQVGLSLFALSPRATGRSLTALTEPTIGAKPNRRTTLENIATWAKEGEEPEFTKADVSQWSDDELKAYVNSKLGMGSAAQDYAKTATPQPGMDKGFDEVHVEQSNLDRDSLDNLIKTVAESKTRERSPEAMEAYLNLKGLGDRDIWLPSEAIAENYGGTTPHSDDGKFGWVDNIAERLSNASELGSEISIPMSKYLANIDPGVHSEFKDLIRVDDGLTKQEADDWIDAFHTEYTEDAEKEDIENMTKDPDIRQPTNSGPKEYGVEDFLPLKQDVRAQPGANTARLAKLLGPKLYGEPSNMDKVTVKELLQNAYDAIKGSLERGELPDGGKITLDLDHVNRVIRMIDNGTGMAPETLAKEFLEIAGTKKETTQASGGLGIAKMLVNFANKGLHVQTMRNGKVSELTTHGEELMASLQDPSLAPTVKVSAPRAEHKKMFPEGHGTYVEVTIPETYIDSQTGEKRGIAFEPDSDYHPVLTRSPLFGNISVAVSNPYTGVYRSLPVGAQFPADKFTQFPPAKFEWGSAQIFVSKEQGQISKWQENVHFLSNGIWQFSQHLKANPMDFGSDNIPHQFYIDVYPKAAPEEAGYPFDLNRQGLTRDAKDSFQQILNYISKTYQQLDFASQAKSYGDIQYLSPGKGGVEVSKRVQLEPKIPPSKTSMTGLKDTDKIEFKGDNMYVNGKEMPSLKNEDLKKARINIDELMVDQKLIDPNRVMLHSSMETTEGSSKVLKRHAEISKRLEEIDKRSEQGFPGTPEGRLEMENLDREYTLLNKELDNLPAPTGEEVWRPLDEVAREKFGANFDEFMYEVGSTFLRLRDAIAQVMGDEYKGLKREAIGISFDHTYRGVSIRVPFAGSFINPALPVYDDPVRAAVGTIGTMIHELAHYKVRSHDAEFPAEMQKIQIYLDMLQMLNASGDNRALNLQGMKNALVKTFKKHEEVFKWLRATIDDQTRTRTRGRRIKGSEQSTGEGGAPGDMETGRAQGTPNGGPVEGRPAQSADLNTPGAGNRGFSFNPEQQLAQILIHAEKKSLYLAPLFKNAKSAGMTQKQFSAYSKKLQAMDEADYEKALAAAHKEVQRTLTPEWQGEYNEIRQQVESDFNSRPDIAANRAFRQGRLPTGESWQPPKLDRTAVEYMGGAGALKGLTEKGGVHPDDAATMFGYESGRELVQSLTDFDRGRGRKTPESYIEQLINEEATSRMYARHGDIRERVAERAQEIALENHHVDILITELKQLASQSGQLPFTLDQIERRVTELFGRVPAKEAKYRVYQKAVFKAGRMAEEHLLAGKFDRAFKAKQTQLYAVLAAKKARSFEAYRKSQENTFKRLANNASLGSIEQPYVDYSHNILAALGYGPQWPNRATEPFSGFVDAHNGSIGAAYWLYDPTAARPDINYKNLTVDEFTALAKTIQSLMHNGRQEKKINGVYGRAELDNVVHDIVGELARMPDVHQPAIRSVRQSVARRIRQLNAAHMLVERMLDYTDQFDPNGPLTMYLDRPFRESYNDEIKLQEASVKKLKHINKKYTDTSIYDTIENHIILDPLDGHKTMRMTRINLRELIKHWGSESGRQKVMNGFNVTEDGVNDLIARNATKADIEYANEMWDLHDQLWRRSADMQYRVTGVEADPLEKRPFDIKLASGETVHANGGHAPVRYDKERSSIAQDVMMKGDLFDNNYIPAMPPQGYTVPRTNYKGFLDLTARLEASHLMGVIHDITFREAVLNARKLILGRGGAPFRMAMRQKWGVEYDSLLDGWLKDIANSHNVEEDYMRGAEHAFAILRQNIVGSLIFLKPSVMVKHGLSALGMSTSQVGAKDMLSAMYDVGAGGMVQAGKDLFKEKGMEPDPDFVAAYRLLAANSNLRQFIYNSSPMMRARRRTYSNTVRGAVEAMQSAGWKRKLVDARQVSFSVGRLGVAMSDMLSADAEWYAAYKKHFAASGDHNESVFQADRAVTRAHGSNFVGDKPAIMRTRNELIRNIAILYTYWNHYFNNMLQLSKDTGAYFRGQEEPGANLASISSRLAYLFVTAVAADVLAQRLFTHDKESLAEQLFWASLRQLGAGYVGIRDITNAAFGGFEPTVGAVGLMFKNLAYLGKDLHSQMNTGHGGRDWLRHFSSFIGMATGIGGDQVGATATGVANLFTGAEQPRGPGELVKQLTTGHPRPAR